MRRDSKIQVFNNQTFRLCNGTRINLNPQVPVLLAERKTLQTGKSAICVRQVR